MPPLGLSCLRRKIGPGMDKLKSPQHAPNRYYGTLAPPGVTEVITGAGAAIARLIMIDHRITQDIT